MAEHDVEQVWHDFWIPLLDEAFFADPVAGAITLPRSAFEQVKRELYDYHVLVKGLPGFFDDITGGRCTKPNTDLQVVTQLVDERGAARYDEGYAEGYEEGHANGIEIGLEEARSRI